MTFGEQQALTALRRSRQGAGRHPHHILLLPALFQGWQRLATGGSRGPRLGGPAPCFPPHATDGHPLAVRVSACLSVQPCCSLLAPVRLPPPSVWLSSVTAFLSGATCSEAQLSRIVWVIGWWLRRAEDPHPRLAFSDPHLPCPPRAELPPPGSHQIAPGEQNGLLNAWMRGRSR